MSKSILSREYGRKEANWWTQHNADDVAKGYAPAGLGHMLTIAWKKGFESGQRHQKKLQKERESQMKMVDQQRQEIVGREHK